jgi:hypothetical protein
MVAVVFWMMTFWGAATLGALGEHLVTSGLPLGAAGVMDRFAQVNQYLTTRPIDGWGDNGTVELRALARWLLTCTAPSDRLLVTWFAPDLPFYAERPFAGGQAYLVPDWHSSVDDQQLTVERLGRQRVPVVLSEVESEPAIHGAFPIVFDYIDRRYALAARSTFGSSSEYDVFVDRAIPPRGTYEPFSLPCFR